jgi:predicted ester cyclase
MSTEENKARYREYLDALRHPDKLPPLLADGFVAHDLPPGMTLLDFRKLVMKAFPDQELTAWHLIAEGDLVAAHLRGTGTHRGVFRGIAPTGRVLTFEIFDYVRFDDEGRIAERWTLVDWIGLYRQMGVTEIPQG